MSPQTLKHLRERILERHHPAEADSSVTWRAAVAVLLREAQGELEVLVIRRAERDGDPWSGDAALPGGRASAEDSSLEETAVRETFEEIGLDLRQPYVELLGRLSEHPRENLRRWARFRVTPVVFCVGSAVTLKLDSREVAAAHWIPLTALRARENQHSRFFWWRPLKRVPVRVPWLVATWRYADLTIWGLTHGILSELLESIG